MSEEYSRGVLRVCLAQICQNLGWHSTQSTPLELLTDVLERYLFQLGKVTHRYSEQFGRTDPNLDDVALAFRHLDINLSELEEYVNHVEPLPFAHDIVEFPAPKPCNLRFPNPDSKELQTREDHIPSYMPLMYPEEEGEVEHQPEIAENLVSSNENPSQETPTVIALVSPLPGDKRILTSPPDTIPMKKRARLSSTCLPEEAAHSQYEMKAVVITVSGELTPTKGGKLPDARTPPPGFSKTMYDKEHFVMKKKGGKVEIPFVPKVPPVKLDRETPSKPESKKTEEIIIYPDGSSKKVLKSKSEGFVHKDKSFSHKKVHKMPFSSSSTHKSSKLWTPNSSKAKKKGGRPVGRPRSRSKSPRGGSKSPSRAKSPAQASGSPRGRGRPPKDKSLLKTPEKKPTVKAPYTAPTVEEIFTGEGVLDLSVSSKKKQEETVSHEPVVIKPEETEVNSVPLDLSTHKEEEVKSTSNAEISEPINVPHPRPRGRPPISPEKKRARELAIAASIDAVVDRNREELKREELEKEKGDTAKETEEKDSVKDMDELKKSDILMETYSEPSVKIEVKDTKPSQGHQNLDLPNEAVEIKQETVETDNKSPVLQPVSADLKKKKKKNKDKNEDQVKEKLKEKLKMKENNAKEIKQEILIDNKESENLPVVSDLSQVQEQSTGVFDFAPSPKKTEEIKTEPVKLFTVDFADCNKEGEHGRERSKDKERSKEHKKEKKEKKKDKEKKKKKDKFRDKEKKKEKSGDYPTEYPTVSKLKIRLGSTPSASTVNVMDLPKASPIHEIVSPKDSPSARPELKLVIKALPPLASQDRESPSSTPKHSHKEKDRSKKESKQEKKEKKEREQREKEMKEKELQEQKEMELKEAEMQRLQAIQERKEQEEKERKEKEMKERELQEKLQREQQQRENERWEEIRKNTKPLLLVETPVASRSQGPLRAPTPTVESPPPKSPSPDARISFTPSPSPSSQSTRKTFTPSPSNSPHRSSSPMRSLRDSQSQSPTRIKSRSQSPIHTPSPSRTPSPGPSPIPSPLPLRPSVSPTPTKPTTPSISPEHSPTPSPRPAAPREEIIPPIPPPSICVPPVVKPSVQRTVTVETVTTFIDESGAKVWICPACKMPDDGSPMIGCDICDDWYHWPCVNLKESPPEDEPWYCVRCMPSKQKVAKRGRGRGRGRGTGRGRKKSLL